MRHHHISEHHLAHDASLEAHEEVCPGVRQELGPHTPLWVAKPLPRKGLLVKNYSLEAFPPFFRDSCAQSTNLRAVQSRDGKLSLKSAPTPPQRKWT